MAITIDTGVTLDMVKARLRIDYDEGDTDLESAIDQSGAIVLDYIKRDSIADLTPIGLQCVQAAVILMVGFIWDGEDSDGRKYVAGDGYLPRKVTSILHRQRDPAIA